MESLVAADPTSTPDEGKRVEEFEGRLKHALEQSLMLQMKQMRNIDMLEKDIKVSEACALSKPCVRVTCVCIDIPIYIYNVLYKHIICVYALCWCGCGSRRKGTGGHLGMEYCAVGNGRYLCVRVCACVCVRMRARVCVYACACRHPYIYADIDVYVYITDIDIPILEGYCC